ncbi:cilia- and flagella-associated protein 206 [Embiotoca jacksoni]|uniref:cilia- and flagella-associated protein 206 n=1 Tax=Embiotoca jacksoni TaxID=100190 RepID=UPI0037045236
MSRAHGETVIKNIIDEVARECAGRGHAVSDTLVAFMVKAVLLDSRNGFNEDRTLTSQDVHKLEELCVDRLMEKCSPALDTIKMQVFFEMNYMSRRDFLQEVHRVLEAELNAVSRPITDSRVKSREDCDALYRRITSYILQRSSMGSPADSSAVQEATAALQSVFPQTEVGAFTVLLKRDKEQQLSELSMIVTGICLFNRASRGTEAGLPVHQLMPAALGEALPVASRSIEDQLRGTQSLVWKYTALLETLTDPATPDGQRDVPAVLLRQALYNVRQHQVFLKVLLADACSCVKNVEVLQKELSAQMKLLKETVQSKTAMPTATVFPLFRVLSTLWSGLQDEAELLNILHSITLNLQPFLASQADIFSAAYLDGLLETSEVKTDEQRMARSSGEQVDPAQVNADEWLLQETSASSEELPLQYNGVCGFTLVDKDGLLLPGNPHIGVLKHKEKLYVFSSKEAALKFSSSPDDFIRAVEERARCSPELIQLLRLHQVSSVSPDSEQGESFPAKPITKCEIGTQTDLHPTPTHIVRSYEWNEWQLRRKALKLADLRTKVTHSVQTDESHLRRDNVSQTWPPRDAACQTKRDGVSNVPKPQVYLAGVRGQRDAQVVQTDLTRAVDE